MKFKDKLRKTKRNAMIAVIPLFLAILYFIIMIIKGVYFWTDGSDFKLAQSIHELCRLVISSTYIFPLNIVWEKAQFFPFEGGSQLDVFKVMIPPLVVVFLSCMFIGEHFRVKKKFLELKVEIDKEIALKEMRKDAGLETVPEGATVDIIIDQAETKAKAWQDTWWGRIAIGVCIALIVAIVGINKF